MDSGVIFIDFRIFFGRPRGPPGAPFSALARPEAVREAKQMHKIWFQVHFGRMAEFCLEPRLFFDENRMNNEVFARRHYLRFGAKLAPKRSPKGGFGDRFGV